MDEVKFYSMISGAPELVATIQYKDGILSISGQKRYANILFKGTDRKDPKAVTAAMKIAPTRFDGSYLRATYALDSMKIILKNKGGPGSGNHGHSGIPGHQGGSASSKTSSVSDLIPDTFNTENAVGVYSYAGPGLANVSSAYNMSKEKYIEIYEREAKALLEEANITIRTSEKDLQRILREGGYKPLAESGKSSAPYRENGETLKGYKNIREEAERRYYGVNQHPIYGYLEKDKGGQHTTTQYGEVSIVLKPEVKNRSTFTTSDSLDHSRSRMIPSPIAKPSVYSDICSTNFGNPLDSVRWRDGSPKTVDDGLYWEAQIFGGVKLADISSIYFPAQPSESTIRLLVAANIPYDIVRTRTYEDYNKVAESHNE